MDLRSYDRLFPNQDVMPEGGFGNLIAAPLQRRYRDDGLTVFLNPDPPIGSVDGSGLSVP
jgi:hypothetical protein